MSEPEGRRVISWNPGKQPWSAVMGCGESGSLIWQREMVSEGRLMKLLSYTEFDNAVSIHVIQMVQTLRCEQVNCRYIYRSHATCYSDIHYRLLKNRINHNNLCV